MKSLTSVAALAAATLSFTPTIAQDTAGTQSTQVVSYADLDLTRPDDVRTFDRRLRVAIEEVCGPTSPADPVGKRIVLSCREDLREQVAERREAVLAGVARDEPIRIAMER